MQKFITLFLLINIAKGAQIVSPEQCRTFPCKIFEDNFDYLDTNVWEHEVTMSGGGNHEFQIYVNNRSVSYTKNGRLHIKPQLVSEWKDKKFLESGYIDLWGMNGINSMCTANVYSGCYRQGTKEKLINPIMSARLRTLKSFSFRYGRLQVRAKVPRGQWLWPAIWMLPDGFHYGDWPASGEMDIFEMRGNDVYGPESWMLNNKHGGSTLHWGPYYSLNRFLSTHKSYRSPDGGRLSDNYHTWTVEWTDKHIKYWLDNDKKPYFVVDPKTSFWDYGNFSREGNIDNPWENGGKMAPFDKKFFLIINLAIGGTGGYFPDNLLSQPSKPWNNSQSYDRAITSFWKAKNLWLPSWQDWNGKISENAALKVDYIRVFKMKNKNI